MWCDLFSELNTDPDFTADGREFLLTSAHHRTSTLACRWQILSATCTSLWTETRPTSPPPVAITCGSTGCPRCRNVGRTGTGVFGDGEAAAHSLTRQEGLLKE